jgi:hypothetical protein
VYQPWVKYAVSNPILNDIMQYRGVDPAKRVQLQTDWNQPVYGPLIFAIIFIVVASVPAVYTVRKQQNRRVRRPADVDPK